MNITNIEWTDLTSNPIKFRNRAGDVVWGCVHASPGCQHCYAETLAKRYGRGGPFNVPTMAGLTPFMDDAELRKMLTAKRIGGKDVRGSRCFVGDMTDIFGDWVSEELLDRLFAVFALRPDVTFQILTKRAEPMHAYITTEFRANRVFDQMKALTPDAGVWTWPTWAEAMQRVWLGVSCEDQQRADERIPWLLRTPAAVRFISAEPLLGPIGFKRAWWPRDRPGRIDWLIAGGESNGRRCDVEWIRSLVMQCRGAGVACFVKQLGSFIVDRNDAGFRGEEPHHWPDVIDQEDRIEHDLDGTRDGYQGAPVRIHLTDRKGGDPSEWPEDLRVREFPASAVRT